MFANLVSRLLTYRRSTALVGVVVFLCTMFGSVHLTADLTGREFYGHRSEDTTGLAEFVGRWGNDANVLIAVASAGVESVLTPSRMRVMAEVAASVREVDGVSAAWSLQDYPRFQTDWPGATEQGVILGRAVTRDSLLPPVSMAPSDSLLLASWQRTQLADPLLVPAVLSEDGRLSVVFIDLDDSLEKVNELRGPLAAIEAVVSRYQGVEGLRWELTGQPAISVSLLEVVFENQVLLVPLSIALVAGLLAFIYRRSHAVLLPIVTGISSVVLLLGVMGWTGQPLGLLNQFYFTMIPVVVMVDCVHVVERQAWEQRFGSATGGIESVISSTYAKVGLACLLTSLTTAVGFLSLGIGEIPALRDFGLYAALGIILGFILVVTLVPLGLLRAGNSKLRATPVIDRLLRSIARTVISRPAFICTLGFLSLVGLAAMAVHVTVGSTLTSNLPSEAPANAAGRVLDRHLSGLFRFDIVIEGPEMDRYEVLREIDDLEARWRKLPMIRTVMGPGTAVRHASRWTDGGEVVPVAEEDVPDYYQSLLWFSELPPVVSDDFRYARIVVTLPDLGTSAILRLGQELLAEARDVLNRYDLNLAITGTQWNLYLGYSDIGNDLRRSLIFAIAAIVLFMAIMFRSISVPVLMLLPNMLPLLAGYAVLAAVGWQLSIVPAVVLALAVGIVVDDSIHMLARIREELRGGMNGDNAVYRAILQSGRAILISTFVLVAGFSVNGISRFPINQTFALIGTTILVGALLCDLFLLPALFLQWRRWNQSFSLGLSWKR